MLRYLRSTRAGHVLPRILNSFRIAGLIALVVGCIFGLLIWKTTDNLPLALLLGADTIIGTGFVLFNLVEVDE